MLLEYISQFYRTLIPTPLWFGFFSNYYDTGAVFAIIVTAGYLMIKGAVILSRARDLAKAVINFIRDKVIYLSVYLSIQCSCQDFHIWWCHPRF